MNIWNWKKRIRQTRCCRCIFKFQNAKIKISLSYINFKSKYQHSNEKSLSNQKQCYKQHLKITLKEIPMTSIASRKMELSLFTRNIFKVIFQISFTFSWEKHGAQCFYEAKGPRNVSIIYNIFDCVLFLNDFVNIQLSQFFFQQFLSVFIFSQYFFNTVVFANIYQLSFLNIFVSTLHAPYGPYDFTQ